MVHQAGAHDMSAIHDGVTPWWLEPRMLPELPAPWDVATQFREALRYSLAGAYQGALLAVAALTLAVAGIPFRGIVVLPVVAGLPLWIVSEAFLVPRPGRPFLRDFASRFPGLWEWSRFAIVREDRRAARGVLLLHGLVFALLVPTAWAAWPDPLLRACTLVTAGTGAALTALHLAVLATGVNSAGIRMRTARSGRALRA